MKKLIIITLLLTILIGCKKETTYTDVTEIESNVVYYANKDYFITVKNSGCQNFELRSDATENPNLVIFEQIGGNSAYWEKDFEINKGDYFIFDACDVSLKYILN